MPSSCSAASVFRQRASQLDVHSGCAFHIEGQQKTHPIPSANFGETGFRDRPCRKVSAALRDALPVGGPYPAQDCASHAGGVASASRQPESGHAFELPRARAQRQQLQPIRLGRTTRRVSPCAAGHRAWHCRPHVDAQAPRRKVRIVMRANFAASRTLLSCKDRRLRQHHHLWKTAKRWGMESATPPSNLTTLDGNRTHRHGNRRRCPDPLDIPAAGRSW